MEMYKLSIEGYTKLLEMVGDCRENGVCAWLVYMDWRDGENSFRACKDPTTLLNLKVRFEENGDSVNAHISISEHGSEKDRNELIDTIFNCLNNERMIKEGMEPVIVLYEWYSRQCLSIAIDDVIAKKNGCVVKAKNVWLMDQVMSVAEIAMRNRDNDGTLKK